MLPFTECLEGRTYKVLPQFAGAVSAAFIAFNTGSLVGLPSSLIPQLENEQDERLKINFEEASWIATLYLIAGLPSCLIGGYISAQFGRRLPIIVAGLPLFMSWVMIALAPSIPVIYLARMISAVSICSTHPSMGVFVSEISHPDLRGSLGVFPSIFLALGILKVYILGPLVRWRTMCWVCSVPPLLLVLSMSYLPETPYWLVENCREAEARRSLQWYRGQAYNIHAEIEEIIERKRRKDEAGGGKARSAAATLRRLVDSSFLRPFSCAGVLYLMAQWTGTSTMVFYMTNIFQNSGSSGIDASVAPIIVAVIRVVTAVVASLVLRSANRKHLFTCSSLLISISTFTIATFSFYRHSLSSHELVGLIPLLATVLMFIGHALGVVPVCQLVAAEVFPTDIRTLGSGLCVAVATVANAINAKMFPWLLQWIGFHGCFWLYSAVSLAMAGYGVWTIPDNRGLSLVKIEETFQKKAPKIEETFQTKAPK